VVKGLERFAAGSRFGKLVVTQAPESHASFVVCTCDCGHTKPLTLTSLKTGTKSCGCGRVDAGKLNAKGPGESLYRHLFNNYKGGAKKRGYTFEITVEQFTLLVQSLCHYCGAKPFTVCKQKTKAGSVLYNGIDRLDNAQGYVAGNVVSCCRHCNRAKAELSVDDFLGLVKRICEHQKL
jgi:hypothetical protein